MGAIVSTKKKVGHGKTKNYQQVFTRTFAVGAFSKDIGDENDVTREDHILTENNLSPSKQNKENDYYRSTSPNIAVASWGEGIVGTLEHDNHETGHVTSRGIDVDVETSATLYTDFAKVTSPRILSREDDIHETGHVTSRGMDVDVETSATLYTDFAKVTSPRFLSREDAAIKIQSHFRKHRARQKFLKRRESSLRIQKYVRGHQERKSLKLQNDSAVKIQRHFRNILEKRESRKLIEIQENTEDIKEKGKPWNESTPTLPPREMKIGDQTKDNFDNFQDDINELRWKSEQQIENTTLGDDYVPQKILLIASNTPKSELLASVTISNVNVCLYNFAEMTLDGMLEQIIASLNDYRTGSKAKRIGFVCHRGPGHVYLVKGTVLTAEKLQKDDMLKDFFKKLSHHMSKLDPSDVKIQLLGNNSVGKKAIAKQDKLITSISKLMKPNKVVVESPLEFMNEGDNMLEEYFDIEKYRVWKRIRHSKLSVIKL